MRKFPWVLILVASAAPPAAAANPLVDGIGTHVPDAFPDDDDPTPLPIDTYVESVDHGAPALVTRDGVSYLEVTGTIHGRGWGGFAEPVLEDPSISVFAMAHYRYHVGFVLRWPVGWNGDTLVIYRHGADPMSLQRYVEDVLGSALNDYHHEELEGDRAVADGVIGRLGAAYFAVNADGLTAEPGFVASATYEDDAVSGGYSLAGIHPSMAFDIPLARDTAEVGRRLVSSLGGRTVRAVIGIGASGGSASLVGAVCGRDGWRLRFDSSGWHTARTGGNFRRAYDPSSGEIFDAAAPIAFARIDLFAFPAYDLSLQVTDPEFPLTAPIAFIQGLGDDFVLSHVLLASELLDRGVALRGRIIAVQVGNVSHYSSDMAAGTPNVSAAFGFGMESEPLGPVVAGVVRALADHVLRGAPLPDSAMDPPPLVAPLVVDSRYDTFDPGGRFFAPASRPLSASETAAWSSVQAALGGGPALRLPITAARLGGFDVPGFGAFFTPFPTGAETRTPAQVWGNYGRWRARAGEVVRELADRRLYDATLGTRVINDPRWRALFQAP